MRKIFKIFFLCAFLFWAEIFTGSRAICTELPNQVYADSRIVLENREVKEEKGFLFTRVDFKHKSGSSAYLLESKASLYAQRNFAIYISGKITWKDDFSKEEQQLTKALFWQVTSVSAVLKGLTLIHKSSHKGMFSFIYAVDLPHQGICEASQDQIVEKIQLKAKNRNKPFDYLTYLELGLRKPKIFNPKIAVNKSLLESTATLLNTNGYPLMAYCFWHQALYMDKNNASLHRKVLDNLNGVDFVRFSKLLSPIT